MKLTSAGKRCVLGGWRVSRAGGIGVSAPVDSFTVVSNGDEADYSPLTIQSELVERE